MFRPTSEDWPEREKKIYCVSCLHHARLGFYKVQRRERKRREKEARKRRKTSKTSNNAGSHSRVFKWPLEVGPTNKIETLCLFGINELAGLSINL
jgi:hypothetical protein